MRLVLAFLCCVVAWEPTLSGQTVLWTESAPKTPRSGERFRYRVRTSSPAATKVTFVAGATETPLILIGDRLWETDLIAPSIDPREIFSRVIGTIRVYQGQTVTDSTSVISHPVSEDLPPASIVRLADDAQRSDWVINLRVPEFYDQMTASGDSMRIFPELATRRLYQLLNDDFDFIHLVVGSFDLVQDRVHTAVQNSVQGIGRNQFNFTSNYGSKGKLLGLNIYPNMHFVDAADSSTSHDIGHQWIQYVNTPPLTGGPHWPISSMATGIMGFNDGIKEHADLPCVYTERAGGGYTGAPRTKEAFNDFDLYLMGLIGVSEVRPQIQIVDPNRLDGALKGKCEDLPAGQSRPVTVDDIVRIVGARVPNASTAAKSFRAAFVVVSRDTLLNADEMAFYEFMARRNDEKGLVPTSQGSVLGYGRPFSENTERKAQYSAKLTTSGFPEIDYGGVTNAASFANEAVAPASVATLFGKGLAPAVANASGVPLPTTLAGVRVFVNGRPAPLFYVSPTQVNFQLPADLKITPTSNVDPAYLASVRVERSGFNSNVAYVSVRANAPGIVTYDDGYVIAQDAQFKLVGRDDPAKAGESIVFYFVGASQLTETVPEGTAAPLDRLIRVTAPVELKIGSLQIAPAFIGLTPGGVGLMQVNAALPASMSGGEYTMTLTIGGRPSNTVKLRVK